MRIILDHRRKTIVPTPVSNVRTFPETVQVALDPSSSDVTMTDACAIDHRPVSS
jgi:hypothetical protein